MDHVYKTLQVATPEQAQEVHAYIRKWLGDKVSQDVSSATRIIYGALCFFIASLQDMCYALYFQSPRCRFAIT